MVSAAMIEFYKLEIKYGNALSIPEDELSKVRRKLNVAKEMPGRPKETNKRGGTSKRVLEKVDKIEALYSKGVTPEDISNQVGVSKTRVYQLARKFGIAQKYGYKDYSYRIIRDNEVHYFKNLELVGLYFGVTGYKATKKFIEDGQINGFKLETGKFWAVEGETHDDDTGR